MRPFPRGLAPVLAVSAAGLILAAVWFGLRTENAPARPPDSPAPGGESPRERQPPAPPAADARIGEPGGPSEEMAEWRLQHLLMPIEGVQPGQLHDNFSETRGGSRRHEAIDILAPRNTPVRAVADGTVAKLFDSVPGGNTIYQFDPEGRYCYYYAHLEGYARGLGESDPITRGQVIGYVGTSGNAPRGTPHLHFAIYRLGPDRRWWKGEPINPFPLLGGSD